METVNQAKLLWRENPDDPGYTDELWVNETTKQIIIQAGNRTYAMSLKEWAALAAVEHRLSLMEARLLGQAAYEKAFRPDGVLLQHILAFLGVEDVPYVAEFEQAKERIANLEATLVRLNKTLRLEDVINVDYEQLKAAGEAYRNKPIPPSAPDEEEATNAIGGVSVEQAQQGLLAYFQRGIRGWK